MSMVNDKIRSINEQRDLFANFNERSTRYHSAIKTITKSTTLDKGDFLAHYRETVKDPHSAAFKFTVAGTVGIALGGLGIIFGRRGLAEFRKNIGSLAERLKDSAIQDGSFIAKTKAAVVGGFSKVLNGYYSLEKGRDVGLMQGLRAIDTGFSKIGMSFFRPGEWLIKVSKWSLWFTKLSLKGFYTGAKKDVKAAGTVMTRNINKITNREEKAALQRATEFLSGQKFDTFVGQVDNLQTGLNGRIQEIHKKIENRIIPAYLESYFPRPKKIFSWSAWADEFTRLRKQWGNAFSQKGSDNTDILRENWSGPTGANIEAGLQNKIMGPDTSLGESINELDDIVKGLNEFAAQNNTSAAFKEIQASLKKAKESVEFAIKFETSGMDTGRFTGSYAGRVIDLGAGGGITETLVPLVTLGILGHNTFKHSKKDDSVIDMTKRFFGNGGFELVGSLGAWFTVAVILGVNGPNAIIAAFASALGLNIIKKTFNKFTGNTKNKEPEIKPELQ